MTALLVVFGALLNPEAAVLLACWAWLPWVLLLAGRAPAWVAAPVVALLACAGAPLLLALGLAGSAWRCWRLASWRQAWAVGLLAAAPAVLESLRLSRGQVSVALPGWPLAWLGPPLLVAQAALLGVAGLLLALGLGRRRPLLLLGPLAALLALAPLMFAPRGEGHSGPMPGYLAMLTRHQAPPGGLPNDLEALKRERWTGAVGGLAPRASWDRWQRLSLLQQRDADTLALAAVGWLDGDAPQRWYRAVPAAVVDSAEGPEQALKAGASLFERPLRLARDPAPPGAWGWNVLEPQAVAPGAWDLRWDQGHGGWAFLSESDDPGWVALGPRGPLAVHETEASFLAAAIPPGVNAIKWRYRPYFWRFESLLALLGLCLWGYSLSRSGASLAA
jgi:hypothetical protein